MMDKKPLTDGRGSNGRFEAGNRFSKGNPYIAFQAKHRTALFASARDDDCARSLEVLRKIRDDATADRRDRIRAANSILDRLSGQPESTFTLATMDGLWGAVQTLEDNKDNGGPAPQP